MSGVVTSDVPDRPSAPLPAYNPSLLVLEVVEILGRNGITVIVDLGNSNTAIHAAADLLRAVGVRPESAPWRP